MALNPRGGCNPMETIPVVYRGGHLMAVCMAVVGVYALWKMALQMHKNRDSDVVTARGINFILAHTVISTLWIAMASLRGVRLTEGVCRWPLDLIQHGLLQGSWVCVWALRVVSLEAVAFHRVPHMSSGILFGVAVVLLPILAAVNAAVRGECGVFVVSDAFAALTVLVHLGLMHATILRYRRLPAPLRVSPEAEWCCFVAFLLMVVVAFCIGTTHEYAARYILTPIMVVWVTLAWQFVQCKPAFVSRDESYDHVMQTFGETAPLCEEPAPKAISREERAHTNERITAFLFHCKEQYPATVHMVRVLTRQLHLRVLDPGGADSKAVSRGELNRVRFVDTRTASGILNNEYVGHEFAIPSTIAMHDCAALRSHAYAFLLTNCEAAYTRECERRIAIVKRLQQPLFQHPAMSVTV
jgi:hypothetical protein